MQCQPTHDFVVLECFGAANHCFHMHGYILQWNLQATHKRNKTQIQISGNLPGNTKSLNLLFIFKEKSNQLLKLSISILHLYYYGERYYSSSDVVSSSLTIYCTKKILKEDSCFFKFLLFMNTIQDTMLHNWFATENGTGIDQSWTIRTPHCIIVCNV